MSLGEHGSQSIPTDDPDGEVAELKARYRALVEQIPAVLYVNDVDEDETTLYVSPQAETILGIDAQAGARWVDRVHPDDHDRVVENYEDFKRNAREGVDEFRFIRPDGREIWIHDRVTIIRDRAGGPVLVQGVMFDITEQKQAQVILGRHAELLEKVDAIGQRFTDLVLGGADVRRILDTLSAIVGDPVILEDAAHQLVAYAEHSTQLAELLEGWASHSRSDHPRASGPRGVAEASDGGPSCSWTSIQLHDEEWGRIHLLELESPITEIDRLALDRAAAAVGLTLLSERESARLADSARAELISDIWHGRWASANEVIARARSLGAELSNARLAAIVAEVVGEPDPTDPSQGPIERRRLRERVQLALRGTLDTHGIPALSALVDERLLCIVGLPAEADLRTTLDDVVRDALERLADLPAGTAVVIGASAEATPMTLRRALTEASEAAAHGSQVSAESAMHHFDDLGLLQLLTRLSEGPELARFVEGELGPLLEHDATGRAPLLQTLQAYLDSGGQKARAARELHLERRSLYYRLERIERLLGRSLEDPATRLRLDVALQGFDLLRQRSNRPGSRPMGPPDP